MIGLPGPYSPDLWRGARIGLLGGSFNPAHEGHRYLSLEAMRALQLDAVWWLVSPQNPLKPVKGMATLTERLRSAQRVADHPRIIPTAIEKDLGTRFTVDTVRRLQERFATTRFVWLMGHDNLMQFHRWKNWRGLFNQLPVCVVNRPPAGNLLRGCPALAYAGQHRIPADDAPLLAGMAAPALVILPVRPHHQSSTALRATGKWP